MFHGVSSFRRLQTAFLRVSQPGAYASFPILHQPCDTTIEATGFFNITVTDGTNPANIYSTSFTNAGYAAGDRIGFTIQGGPLSISNFGSFDNLLITGTGPTPVPLPAVTLLIDEDSIDNGTNCSDVEYATGEGCVSIEECAFGACPFVGGPPIDNDPSVLVNDDIASIPGVDGGCQAVLAINAIASAANAAIVPVPSITLPTGETGDEGLFSPATDAFTDIPGGLPGYINCLDVQDEHFLDGLAGAPLDETSIFALEGRRVCAVVHDSDVSDLGDSQLNAMGGRKGRTAFDVTSVVPHPKGDKLLPVLEVDFLAADEVDEVCTCENLETIDGEPFECSSDG